VRLQSPGISNHRGWRIPQDVCAPFTLALHPLRPDALDDFERAAIRHTLHLVERYGALGAKTSHGQGVVKITGWGTLPAVMETDTWINAMKARPAKEDTNPQPAPDLSEFIGATITLDAAATRSAAGKVAASSGVPAERGATPGSDRCCQKSLVFEHVELGR
jgi:hypothetical protein